MEDEDLESSLFYSCMSSSAASNTTQENEVHGKTDNNIEDGDGINSTPIIRVSKKEDDNIPLPSSVDVDHSKDMSTCLSPLQYESNNSSAPSTTLNKGIDIQQFDANVSKDACSSPQQYESSNMKDMNVSKDTCSSPAKHDSCNNITAHITTDTNKTHYNAAGNPSLPTPDLPTSSSNSNSSWSVLSNKQRPVVRSITFNRDRTCLILITNFGVRVRTLESLHISLQNLNVNDNEEESDNNSNWIHDVPLPPDGATYAQLLHNTSLLAVIKPASPRCCQLFNAKHSSSPLAIMPLSAAVKRVELQRKVLVAMTVDLRLHIFHMSDDGGIYGKALKPTLVTTLNIFHPSDSARNMRGLEGYNAGSYFDLSPNEDEPYLVCKSFNGSPGTVRLYNPTVVQTLPNVNKCSASLGSGRSAISTASSWDRHDNAHHPITKKTKRRLQLLTTINAHDHSVTRMLIGGGGKGKTSLCCTSYLATVSSKGTTIRLFGLPTGDYLWEWHRGKRPCQFYSLSWGGSDCDRLVSYGSSGTIHVFDWAKKREPKVMNYPEGEDDDDGYDFEKVHDDDDEGSRKLVLDSTTPTKPKALLRRLSSPLTHRITGKTKKAPASPPKHRSYTKLKYKPSASASVSSTKTQALIISMLDRDESITSDIAEIEEDRLVVCTIDGELRQYSVQKNVDLTQVEDVLK